MCRHEVDRWFVEGMDRDDLLQEARLEAWLSSLTWRPGGGSSARSWARMHVHSRMQDLLTRSLRMARRGNVEALRLDAPASRDDDSVPLGDLIPDGQPGVHEQAVKRSEPTAKETLHRLAERARLSDFEHRCVLGVMAGQSYAELGNEKAVDNALQRAKTKLRAA
jgi:RNA polymerase sporulation-specific sigma factor